MITSAGNGRIKYVTDLLSKAKLRRKDGKFVAEGIKMFLEAPVSEIDEVYISEELYVKLGSNGNSGSKSRESGVRIVGSSLGDYREIARKLEKVNYEVVSESVFKKISDTVTPQGIVTVIKTVDASIDDMTGGVNPLIVVLENLQDPGNLGTILRTAEGAGADGIVLSRDSVDIYNPKVIRSTMGSVFRMKFAYVDDLHEAIRSMKSKGISVYAAALDETSESYDTKDYTKPSAILIGNEGNGLKEETIKAAGETVYIPMKGQVESLNASVAAAVIMYEAARQRR